MSATKTKVSRQLRHPAMVLGWRECVDLPELGVFGIRAKLDTGARSSSLHATDISTIRRDQHTLVRFHLVLGPRGRSHSIETTAPIVDERVVRDSGGHESLRPVIRTPIEIAGWSWPIEITLASRSDMSFRMLLGRQGMSGHVIVDVSHSYTAGRRSARFSRTKRI